MLYLYIHPSLFNYKISLYQNRALSKGPRTYYPVPMSQNELELLNEEHESHPYIIDETSEGKTVKDLESLQGLLTLLSPKIREAVESLPADYFFMSERELKKYCHPTKVDNQLRVNFWREHDRLVSHIQDRSQRKIINMNRVTRGVCTSQYLYHMVKKTPQKIAYMLIPPMAIEVELRSLMDKGLGRISEIIETKQLHFENGHLDSKAAGVILQAVSFLYTRIHGNPAVISKTQSITQDSSGETRVTREITQTVTAPEPEQQYSMEEIDKKLTELRTKLLPSSTLDIAEPEITEVDCVGKNE